MKKIMFNDKYGLEQAVLEGKKTMTRRIVPDGDLRMAQMEVNVHGGDLAERIKDHSLYLWHDEVAIAQAYKTLRWPALPGIDWFALTDEVTHSKGWTNKMFVKAEYMPHRIRITGINVERLQDISDDDCLREGVEKWMDSYIVTGIMERYQQRNRCFRTPREAFASLIDRISGKGTWDSNPWVFAYSFELISKDE